MRSRWLEWLLVGLLGAGALWIGVFPPAGRPQDLDLQVEVHPVPPVHGEAQRMAATVRWHWLRQPPVRLGRWEDQLTFVYDNDRWVFDQDSRGAYSSDTLQQMLAAYGEPPFILGNVVTAGQDGEATYYFVARDAGLPAAPFRLRVQFMHIRSEEVSMVQSGWVKSTAPRGR